MVKKEETRTTKTPGSTQRLLDEGLDKAHYLLDRKRWDEAINILEDLDRRFPEQPHILAMLMEVYFSLQKMEDYERACEQLVILEPNDPDLALSLAGAYLSNGRPALALKEFQKFLNIWPDHESTEDARVITAQLESSLEKKISGWKIPRDKAIALVVELEQMGQCLERGQYPRGIALGEAIVKQFPFFTPVYKNLSQIFWMEGQVSKAINLMCNILENDPDNISALSELTRYYVLTGSIEQARRSSEKLKRFLPDTLDEAIKIAEALSYLGDDLGVLEIMHTIEKRGEVVNPGSEGALLMHLAAVSFYRTGKEDEARRHWKEALQLSPDFNLAAGNLEDLNKKVGERHAPWTYTINYWIPNKIIEELYRWISPQFPQEKNARVRGNIHRFLKEHKEIISIAPLMLERGDAMCREFVLGLVRLVENGDILKATRDFALERQGPDNVRWEAAKIATNAGLLPTGIIPFWSNGHWTDILLMSIEIDDKNVRKHGKQVEMLLQSALEALHINGGKKAEELLQEALEIEPNEVDLLNNLAMTYQLQGRLDEAYTMVRQIHTRHPDYLLGRTSLAMIYIQEGDLERAEEILEPLRWLKQMNHSEFDAFCVTYIELFLAKKKKEMAKSWFEMWKSVNPENSKLERYRFRFDRSMVVSKKR